MSELPCYTILSLPTDLEAPNEQQLKSDLEKGDTKTKIAALKKVLHLILNGDKIPGLLMTIIRFVLPSQVSFLFIFSNLCHCSPVCWKQVERFNFLGRSHLSILFWEPKKVVRDIAILVQSRLAFLTFTDRYRLTSLFFFF